MENPCETPGQKIRSKGKGRGLARGKGRGPMGIPVQGKRKSGNLWAWRGFAGPIE